MAQSASEFKLPPKADYTNHEDVNAYYDEAIVDLYYKDYIAALGELDRYIEKFPGLIPYFYTYLAAGKPKVVEKVQLSNGTELALVEKPKIALKNRELYLKRLEDELATIKDTTLQMLVERAKKLLLRYEEHAYHFQKDANFISKRSWIKTKGRSVLQVLMGLSGVSYILMQLNNGIGKTFRSYLDSLYPAISGILKTALDPFQFALVSIVGIYEIARAYQKSVLKQRKTKAATAVFNILAGAAGLAVVFAMAANVMWLGVVWLGIGAVGFYRETYVAQQLKKQAALDRIKLQGLTARLENLNDELSKLPKNPDPETQNQINQMQDEKTDLTCQILDLKKQITRSEEKSFLKTREAFFNLLSVVGLALCFASLAFPPLAFAGTAIYLLSSVWNYADKTFKYKSSLRLARWFGLVKPAEKGSEDDTPGAGLNPEPKKTMYYGMSPASIYSGLNVDPGVRNINANDVSCELPVRASTHQQKISPLKDEPVFISPSAGI